MEVYLMRHGETDLNLEDRLQGLVDCPLNGTGLAQAGAAGERVRAAGLTFDRVYSSPLRRAVDTACLAAGCAPEGLRLDERLLEIDYGPYDARPFTELGPEMFAFFRDPEHVDPPAGVESIAALLSRVGAFLAALAEDPAPERVLVVTHGVAIRAFLGHIQGDGSAAVWGMPVENCALYRTRLENGRWTEAELALG